MTNTLRLWPIFLTSTDDVLSIFRFHNCGCITRSTASHHRCDACQHLHVHTRCNSASCRCRAHSYCRYSILLSYLMLYSIGLEWSVVFSCTALHCTVLHSNVLYCTVLYCTVLYCTVLYCTALYCTALQCTVLHCTVLYCTVLYCTVLHCAVLFYTVLYCTVLYCTVRYIFWSSLFTFSSYQCAGILVVLIIVCSISLDDCYCVSNPCHILSSRPGRWIHHRISHEFL